MGREQVDHQKREQFDGLIHVQISDVVADDVRVELAGLLHRFDGEPDVVGHLVLVGFGGHLRRFPLILATLYGSLSLRVEPVRDAEPEVIVVRVENIETALEGQRPEACLFGRSAVHRLEDGHEESVVEELVQVHLRSLEPDALGVDYLVEKLRDFLGGHQMQSSWRSQ